MVTRRRKDTHSAASRGGRLRVVVYEPDAGARAALTGLLEDAGFDAHGCAEVAQALANADPKKPVAAALLDIKHGSAIANTLRQAHPGIRIVFMSTGAVVASCAPNELVHKPIDFRAIEALLLRRSEDRGD